MAATANNSSNARKTKLLLFDVDGTLTPNRQQIQDDVKEFLLQKVLPGATVGLVSGSDLAKLTWQMGGQDTVGKIDYIFSENGLVAHKGEKLLGSQSIAKHLGEDKVQDIINFALSYFSELKLPCKRGNFVEFRTGLINLSPVGRSCSQQQREEFAELDKKEGIRTKLRQALMDKFSGSDLQFVIGGQISIDVFPKGWDKTFCLRYVEKEGFQEIHFFGDRTGEGGNDHGLYVDSRTIGHAVNSPKDTVEQAKKVLGL